MTISSLEDFLWNIYMILEEQNNAEGARPPKQTLTGDTHNNSTHDIDPNNVEQNIT